MITIDKARVDELLSYEAETGLFRWRESRRNVRAGEVAGFFNNYGYRQIGLDGHYHLAHRLAWLVVHGATPAGQIDHINGDRADNRIANLRMATPSQNAQNQRKGRGSTGLLGVTHDPRRGTYRAIIDNRTIGYYPDAESAHAAYVEEKRRVHEYSTL